MNEARRKPTTGTRYPTLCFISGMGSFICTDTAGHTKAFDYPVMDHSGVGGMPVSSARQTETEKLSVATRPQGPPAASWRPIDVS